MSPGDQVTKGSVAFFMAAFEATIPYLAFQAVAQLQRKEATSSKGKAQISTEKSKGNE